MTSLLTEIPNLVMSVRGPLSQVEEHLISKQDEIEAWFSKKWLEYSPPIYSSLDIRNSGFKLSPVDMNLFPCGFNNIHEHSLPKSIDAAKKIFSQSYPGANKILIVPESHTRNLPYFENLAVIQDILSEAGYEVRIGSMIEGLKEASELKLASGKKVLLEPLMREGNKLCVDGFIADLIFSNNDLSTDIPDILLGIEQPFVPPVFVGWQNRSKTIYFQNYNSLCEDFAKHIDLDPWLISPFIQKCDSVDFMKHEGESCLIEHSRNMFEAIQKKYDEYGVTEKPFIVIKADAGTYGMGVMTISDADEITTLNRKRRTHMSTRKGGETIHEVIIQEGIHTIEMWGDDGVPAEPVVYFFGADIIGGFYRINPNRGVDENLNAPGMYFEPMENLTQEVSDDNNRFYPYSVVSRLSVLAAALERKVYEAEQ